MNIVHMYNILTHIRVHNNKPDTTNSTDTHTHLIEVTIRTLISKWTSPPHHGPNRKRPPPVCVRTYLRTPGPGLLPDPGHTHTLCYCVSTAKIGTDIIIRIVYGNFPAETQIMRCNARHPSVHVCSVCVVGRCMRRWRPFARRRMIVCGSIAAHTMRVVPLRTFSSGLRVGAIKLSRMSHRTHAHTTCTASKLMM